MALTRASAAVIKTEEIVNNRNRIINGDMRIDQRNAGASVTPTTTTYTLDRWSLEVTENSKLSVQQNAGSVTPPVGFTNYLGITTASAFSIISSSQFQLRQFIEGFNTADLAWGTANAKTITLSFWVRSSLTGTFGGSFRNNGNDRSYPFSYTISSANTWEYKTITVAGDTTGTWLTNNERGIAVLFGLGVGSTHSGTAGAWAGANYSSATGATSVVGTLNATWYITGVQLEVGSVATPFERRPYGTELSLCQRYCYSIFANQGADTYARYGVGDCRATTVLQTHTYLPVEMRVAPSLTTTSTASNYGVYSGGSVTACSSVPVILGATTRQIAVIDHSVASGLTLGRGGQALSNNNTTSYFIFTAEL